MRREMSLSWTCLSKFLLWPNSSFPKLSSLPPQRQSHARQIPVRDGWSGDDALPFLRVLSRDLLWLRHVQCCCARPEHRAPLERMCFLSSNHSVSLGKGEEEYCLLFAKSPSTVLSKPKLPWKAPSSFWVKNSQMAKNCRPELATLVYPLQCLNGSFVEPLSWY